MYEKWCARYAILSGTHRCPKNMPKLQPRETLRRLRVRPSKKMQTVRRGGGERTDEVQALRRDKTDEGFLARPEQVSGLDHCAACKGHKQCDVKKCWAWRDPDAERWSAKQKILVCGACKSERGCTDKETPLTI